MRKFHLFGHLYLALFSFSVSPSFTPTYSAPRHYHMRPFCTVMGHFTPCPQGQGWFVPALLLSTIYEGTRTLCWRLSPCRAGFTLSGALFRKNVGPLLFPRKKLATFFSHHRPRVSCHSPEKLTTFFCSSLSLTQGSLPLFRYFGHAKNSPLLLWRPPFCGAPVLPNMLNMPKSAAVPLSKNTAMRQSVLCTLLLTDGQ